MKQASAAEFGVSRETEARLREFLALLQRWNARINLVADRDEGSLWQRHVLDSLQLAPLLPPSDGPIVDLGSGAGFPGLILALASNRPTHLIESDRRKAAFLIEAARTLGLPLVKIHPTRIEAVTLPPAAVVSARALAPLPDLLRHAHKLLAPGGIALFPKGRTAEQELTAAARGWNMRVERFPSRTDPASTILRISEIRPVGATA
ncbi:MAG: 16S rRNA (guanine(527)-N(7))-methyltransferase RsmG [Acetobacteraceae bacterium]|nr:16S rRNA (guanine(527)-N(7))-methyltransferase RsmG [Acetobacteraceae bacterium]